MKTILWYCHFFFIACFSCLQTEEISPYDALKELLPFEPHGWYANAMTMEKLIDSRNVKTVIEVGCWLGKSTRHIASLLPPDGKVFAIDHWNGSIEHQPGQSHHHPCLNNLYDHFLSNVIHAGLTDKIVPIRMNSLDAAKMLLASITSETHFDLIYIDASHDYESVYADLKAWYPLVKGQGILCGDDWGHEPIIRAVNQFALEEGLSIDVSESCWCLIDPLIGFSTENQ